jgi:hypothetical protein
MEGFFALLGIAVGICLVCFFCKPFVRSLSSRNWERVDGRVTGVKVRSSTNMQQSTRWTVCVEYRYIYAGASLNGSESVGYSGMGRGDALEVGKNYPAGQLLDVFVYKKDARESTLNEGVNYRAGAAVVFGISLLIFFAARLLP